MPPQNGFVSRVYLSSWSSWHTFLNISLIPKYAWYTFICIQAGSNQGFKSIELFLETTFYAQLGQTYLLWKLFRCFEGLVKLKVTSRWGWRPWLHQVLSFVFWMPLDELVGSLFNGAFCDVKFCMGFLLLPCTSQRFFPASRAQRTGCDQASDISVAFRSDTMRYVRCMDF